MHKRTRQAARDIFIVMMDGCFRINEASKMKWSDIDFDNNISTCTDQKYPVWFFQYEIS